MRTTGPLQSLQANKVIEKPEGTPTLDTTLLTGSEIKNHRISTALAATLMAMAVAAAGAGLYLLFTQ